LIATLVLSAVAHAEPPPNPTATAAWTRPFLWRIEGPSPSFLVGTMHLPDERSPHFPPMLMRALEATQEVVLELDLGVLDQLALGFRLFAPAGRQLRDLAPKPLQQRIRALAQASGANYNLFARMTVWGATLALGSLPHANDKGAVLDEALSRWAEAHGRTVGALETIEEQTAVASGLSPADQLTLLEEQVSELEANDHKEEALRELFFSGDETQARAMLKPEPHTSSAEIAFGKRLIDDRNRRMAERIHARLADGKPRLYAVGAAHLIGDAGVVARLRHSGLKVVRVLH
jgi:uncharacterized protein YbaP (TraB family)